MIEIGSAHYQQVDTPYGLRAILSIGIECCPLIGVEH